MRRNKNMVKRLISADTSETLQFNANDLKQSIKASEGRVIVSENIVTQSNIDEITTAEIAAAFGADMLLMNRLDVFKPEIFGLYPGEDDASHERRESIQRLQKLVGRPIGINLEPIDKKADMVEDRLEISRGCVADTEVLQEAESLGFQFVVLTGNPGTGVSNAATIESLKLAKKHFSGLIIAGKMHGSGVDEPVISKEVVQSFLKAGADVILVPAIGTVPGFDEEELKDIVKLVHNENGLVMSAIGTSQEGSGKSYIENIAMRTKIYGVDIQHIGDSAWGVQSPFENIYALSNAIRGERHTIQRMARSINR